MKALAFVSSIDHCESLASTFRENKIVAYAYHSKQSSKYADELMHGFKNGEIDILVSMGKLTTGFDMPDCNMVLNMRPTKVRSLYTQMIGRVLRIIPGGDPLSKAIIVDLCRSTLDHGLYDESFEIKNTREEAKIETKRSREPVIDYMDSIFSKDFILMRQSMDQYLKEAKSGDKKEARMWQFKYADTHYDLILAASHLYEIFYKQPHRASKVDWIMEGIVPTMSWMSISALRSRLTKMLKEGKKFGGIRGYPQWFKENVLRKGY